jgi:redox-sensitive bicupin YhaK (pirin superfamily)
MTRIRPLQRIVESHATSDGAGVKLRRSLGARGSDRLDPLLMLDAFHSDDPEDYLAGFPPHPHRGFETVTWMFEGRMRHEDHLGNEGDLEPGGAQWMTAGRGIVHSEMPQQSAGRMRGFQLWINLPAAEKMRPADWRDIAAGEIPEQATRGGGRVRVLAGRPVVDGHPLAGPINGHPGERSTDPYYLDVQLAPGECLELPLPAGHNVFLYAHEGRVRTGEAGTAVELHQGAILGDGEAVRLAAGDEGASVLVIAGRPIGEPVAQYGPFVMNTRAELEQALADYRDGRLAEPAADARG